VLIDLRDFQKDKGDIVHRYNADEARLLKKQKHLPENLEIETNENQHNEDVPFEFTTGNDEDMDNSIEEQDARRGQMLPEYSDSEDDAINNDEGEGVTEVGTYFSSNKHHLILPLLPFFLSFSLSLSLSQRFSHFRILE
jgi:hypothetical protein